MLTIADRLFTDRPEKPAAHVWIGLDFGTATTECVIRIERSGDPDQIAALAFGGESRADAKVVLPSAMEIDGDTLLPAHMLSGRGVIIEMFKSLLISDIRTSGDGVELRRADGPYCRSLRHLASVLAFARQSIASWMGSQKLEFHLNVGAPVGADRENHIDAQIRNVFHEIAYRAFELSSKWPMKPPTTQQSLELSATAMAIPVPSLADSYVTVVPEALAAVTSFLSLPSREAAAYATIDVGGGSTDLSFFWFQTGAHDELNERKAWYYSVRSESIGTNLLIDGLGPIPEDSRGIPAHERLRTLSDPRGHIQDENLKAFRDGLDRSYQLAFREAFEVHPALKFWVTGNHRSEAKWTLLLLGGGCGLKFVQDALRSTPPKNSNARHHSTCEFLSATERLRVLLPSGRALLNAATGGRDVLLRCGHLLTVAHGLAFRAPDIPKYESHEPVDPPQLQPRADQPDHGHDG